MAPSSATETQAAEPAAERRPSAASVEMSRPEPDVPYDEKRAAVTIQKRQRGNVARGELGLERGAARALTPIEAWSLAAFSLLHQVAFLFLFTEPGYGDELYRALAPQTGLAYSAGWAGAALCLLAYLLDAHVWRRWGRAWGALAVGFFGAAGLLLLAGLVLLVGPYPQAPLCVYLFVSLGVVCALRELLFARVPTGPFLRAVALPTLCGGLCMLVGWTLWVGLSGEVWSGRTRARHYAAVLCPRRARACLPAAILYFAPMACGLLNASVGFVYLLLSHSAASARPGQRPPLHTSARVFAGAGALIVGAMYVQAAVSGANSALANSVLLFALAALVSFAALAAYSFGLTSVQAKLLSVPLLRKAYGALANDWARALLAFGGWLPLALFLLSALLKQRLRAALWLPRGADEHTDPATGIRVARRAWLPDGAASACAQLGGWAWSSVLSKAIWVGVFFMVMNVGFGKLTNVFVAWLIGALLDARVGLGAVLGAVVAVGLFFFMLPPVPGFAVYLMASFLIPRFVPFWQGVALATAVSFGLKLSACLIQQVLIGQQMGGRVEVRSLIAVNSTTTRAIRKLLSTPGWGVGKVCILVGGPDWPTSVCCGILQLNPLSILLGTTPVLLVVGAVTVAGAAQLRKGEGGAWESVSSMTLGLASAVMFATLAASAYFIEDTAERHRAELEAMPRDEEVDAADRKQAEAARVKGVATAWAHPESPAPWWMRANLLVGAGLQVVACYTAQFFGRACFADFEMTDSIGEKLDGDWTRIFKPAGRAVLLLWLVSCGNLLVFRLWARARVRAHLRSEGLAALTEEGKRGVT